ncbi:chemotaxis protein CheX [Pseudomonas sp. CGJS7]|uniref:chemotaxis protein CheX n=1 Tax=Pseudomonas sp. CGJS7 TaxID=3109348 RepID=UPI00300B83E5
MSDLNETEIRVFIDAITHYFDQLTQEAATVRGAFLDDNGGSVPVYDYSGQIAVSGQFRGTITVSAPRALIRHLLLAMSEQDQSDANLRDTVGELANTLAGNARKHFGSDMQISVPRTAAGAIGKGASRKRPYVIMISWKTYSASLVVDIERLD